MPYTSTITNQILATPFDNKSVVDKIVSDKLTKEEFCTYCYSPPRFLWESLGYRKEDDKEEDEQDYDNDVPTDYKEISDQKYQQNTAFNNFEKWLNNFSDAKVYTINGNAGTGKTTFINYQKYKDKDIVWIILDIYSARSYDEWMTDIRTDISHFEQAQSKVYGSIMNKIWEMVFQGKDSNGNYSLAIVNDNLKRIVRNYQNRYFNQYPSGRKLLDEISKIVKENEEKYLVVEKSAESFRKYIDGKVGDEGQGIIDILNIFILILRCLEEYEGKKYCIVFDNFERFIAKDELYNKDVDDIRLKLTSFIKRINEQGNIHRGCIKLIMAVRDSTARMCGVRLQASDAEANNLDINNWYNTQDIIDLKKKWYIRNNITIENLDIVEQITGDFRVCKDQTVKGLQLFIDPLFNDNKRLIIDFIGTMIESPSNEEYIGYYKQFWKENTSLSKFAARSIIRGMILNELEKKPDKLFEQLKTYSTQKRDTNGVGDARKILSILYNNINRKHDNVVSMESLLTEIFHGGDIRTIWNNKKYNEQRMIITKMLFYMNSYNRRENDWIQFIDIQFKDSKEDIVIKDSEELGRFLDKNMSHCTVHLMPSGKVYLTDIVASFEFFSLRYVTKYEPLFALVPTPEEIKNAKSVKDLPCYILISEVSKFAIKCIQILLESEDTIRLFIDNSRNGKYHYIRIIDKHKSYIDGFLQYVKEKYYLSDQIDTKEKEKYEQLFQEINLLKERYRIHRDKRR